RGPLATGLVGKTLFSGDCRQPSRHRTWWKRLAFQSMPSLSISVRRFIEEDLGDRDAAFAGDGVKQEDSSAFLENRRIAQLIDLSVRRAAHRRRERSVGSFPTPFRTQN